MTIIRAHIIILRCAAFIARRTAQHVNNLVHARPWAALVAVSLASIVVTAWQVGKARAERDRAQHQAYVYRQQLQSAQACLQAEADRTAKTAMP